VGDDLVVYVQNNLKTFLRANLMPASFQFVCDRFQDLRLCHWFRFLMYVGR
jgi:hypothetical protein